MLRVKDDIGFKTTWTIHRFKNDENGFIAESLRHGMSMAEALRLFKENFVGSETWQHNLALNEGIGEALDLIFGLGTPTAFDGTSGYLGVGDSATAADATQTGLQAATNKSYVVFDDNYPARTAQTVEVRSTFGSAVGNHGWQEFTIVNGDEDTHKHLNRKVQDKGTKASEETWTLSLSITLA